MNTVQIALKSIVIIAIVVLLLSILGIFVLSQAGQSGTSASYDRIFFAGCEQIQQRGCAQTTEEYTLVQNDAEFINACRYKYGQDQNALSCVFQFCSSCSKYQTAQQAICGPWCDRVRSRAVANPGGIADDCNSDITCKSLCSACP